MPQDIPRKKKGKGGGQIKKSKNIAGDITDLFALCIIILWCKQKGSCHKYNISDSSSASNLVKKVWSMDQKLGEKWTGGDLENHLLHILQIMFDRCQPPIDPPAKKQLRKQLKYFHDVSLTF